MSVKVRHTNESTLHINSGIARQEQLDASMKAVFNQIRTHYPDDDGYKNAYFISNVITDVKGNIFGYAYAWVSDPRIYYMLIGRNPDGTERYDEYPDPDWVEPTQQRPASNDSLSLGVNWADMIEEEEELDEKYTRPMIRKELPPLVRLPGYRYDDEQLIKAEQIVRSKATPNDDPSKIVVPTLGFFEVSRAYVSEVDKNESGTILCCKWAPTWIDKDMLLPYFERYSTDKNIRHGRIDHKDCNYTYPLITFNRTTDRRTNEPKVLVFVAYSGLAPYDASFALLMTRKFIVENQNDIRENEKLISEGKEPKEVRKSLLVFSHWQNEYKEPAARGSSRSLPDIALTTQPKVKPLTVSKISAVTGRVKH